MKGKRNKCASWVDAVAVLFVGEDRESPCGVAGGKKSEKIVAVVEGEVSFFFFFSSSLLWRPWSSPPESISGHLLCWDGRAGSLGRRASAISLYHGAVGGGTRRDWWEVAQHRTAVKWPFCSQNRLANLF